MAPLPKMVPNRKKIIEAILFLIEEAQREDCELTQYEIVKSLFVADVFHLKKFGRPVIFDNYVAMKFGPVPSEAYDMLKPHYQGRLHFESDWPLWERLPAPERGALACKFVKLKRPANRRRLSQTDMAELTSALKNIRKLGFSGTKDWTHTNSAYKKAWDARGASAAANMDYDLLVPGLDKETVADLVHASKYSF
jgi:uncharacterized phage-associated protein